MINDRYEIYFVLNGLHNGEDGVHAVTCAEEQQPDGWYYLLDGEDDGVGPYTSKDAAASAARTTLKPGKLPSEWAREGYYVIEGAWSPKPGQNIDYYNSHGNKCQGVIKAYDGKTITIDGERKITVTETFKVRFGR